MEHNYIRAKLRFYSPMRGGRPAVPIADGYAPYLRAAPLGMDLPVRLNEMPGNPEFEAQYDVEVELIYHPQIDYSALTMGTVFRMMEGPKAVGEGTVTSAIYRRSQDKPAS